MTTRDQAIVGVIALVAIVAAYLIALSGALSAKAPATVGQPIDFTVVEKEIIPLLGSLELNGQLPVVTNPEEVGKDNPFAL